MALGAGVGVGAIGIGVGSGQAGQQSVGRVTLDVVAREERLVRLEVMTYNVGNGLADPARLVVLLRQLGADLVGLQELAPAQAEAIARELSDVYPYQVLSPTGFSGKGLLSRYPVVASEQLSLHPARPDLRASVDVQGARLSFLVAHPPPPRLHRAGIGFDPAALHQLEALAGLTVQHAPAVLLGDLNMTRRNPVYARFAAVGLADAFAVAGAGRGWTLPRRLGQASRFDHGLHGLPLRPVARVDYIWYTPGLHAEAAWVGPDGGSDHLPVLARLALSRV
jgi:vancomycin resistance protein VanJ